MQWEDERYIRIYTRDTPDWTVWPWQSRALLPLLMRKLDRMGLMELGKHGTVALAALVGLPIEVVGAGLDGLIADGCVVQSGTKLVMRNFIAGQEAVASGSLRQKTWREREKIRDETLRNVDETLANVDGARRGETDGDAARRRETPSLAVPSLAELKEKPSATRKRAQREETKTGASAIAYSDAFFVRYGVRPFRDDKPDRTANSLLAQLVDKLGAEDAPGVAQHFIASNEKLYVVSKHPLNLLCRDYVKLRAEWLGAKRSTNTEAGQTDRTQSNLTAIHGAAERLKEKNRGVV